MPARPSFPGTFPLRQVHLDFHTSPWIPDVAAEFDAPAFVETFRRAHVNSVTIFARCHHGMTYFPSKLTTVHPALGSRDLLGEMIEALHRAGIRCPIYTTVAWDEDLAARHPDWRMLKADGRFARCANPDPSLPAHPGGWHFNDWLNEEYQDLLEAHTREICGRYEVDGLFYDIVFFDPGAHYSAAARRFRAKHGFEANDDETFRRFESLAQEQFAARFTQLVRGLQPKASVFYNSGLHLMVDRSAARSRVRHCTHIEIESLPSGFWGYFHFPRAARSLGRWGQPWLGMTGRFQRMWGDFGGLKPVPALEYECFRSQALGGGNSVGDQLPPRGRLDAGAYDLIGKVYAECAAAEPFYAGSVALPQLGVITANHPAKDPHLTARSDEGAIQMCEEAHYDASLLDEQAELGAFAAIILPDETVITPRLRTKLREYYRRGGKLLLSARAGRDAAGNFALDFLPLELLGEVEKYPSYLRPRARFWPEAAAGERVVYSAGVQARAGKGSEVLVDRVLPYFKRTDLTFCSHFQTPPSTEVDRFPAVVAWPRAVYLAEPIFREYRELGNVFLRDLWQRALERLIGAAPFGAGLPTTVLCVPRRRQRDLLLTLLHYVPLRKAMEKDVLEERMSFAGETLRLPASVPRVRRFDTGEWLEKNAAGEFLLPAVKGRLLLEVPEFFRGERIKRDLSISGAGK